MRLIDADALNERIADSAKNAKDGGAWSQYTTGLLTAAMYADEAPTIKLKREWVSVNDRLPEMRHVVLAFSPHHNNIWALYLHEDGFWYYWMDINRRYDPLWMGPITHWMPLPEPPKEDNDETD